jgi:hypothetical protein
MTINQSINQSINQFTPVYSADVLTTKLFSHASWILVKVAHITDITVIALHSSTDQNHILLTIPN